MENFVREGIKLVVIRGNDKGELHIKRKRAGKPKVKKVELFDRNYHKISKPLNYTDTIIAKAYCDEMEGETVLFTLWEDDAVGSGHNKINEMNKINPIPLRKDVVDGVAEVRFNMALYTQAARIADMQVAKGDKNEGKNHEYYVTVDYYGKMVGESKNVNIQNPNYDNPIQRALELQYPEKFPTKPKEPNKRPTPSPEKPKKDAFKAPITAKATTKAPDPKGKILSAEFVDGNQRPFTNMKFGTSVYAKVRTNGLKGKTVIIKIFEDDLGTNQRVYMESHTLPGDVSLIPIKLSQKMRADGDNLTEGNEQEYFLQIEYAGQSVTSSLVNVNDDAPRIKMETGASTVGVKKQEKKQEDNKVCECEAKVRAFMRIIRIGEGTSTEAGYSTIVGGTSFKEHGKDFSTHPNIYVRAHDSKAAGAYQITLKNWNDQSFVKWRKENKIDDFYPESQDMYCVYLIKEKKKALDFIKNDDIEGAINRCRQEWASLPGAGYGQREEKIETLLDKYNRYYKEELNGPTNHLHIKKGFLKIFKESCCEDKNINNGEINKYKIEIDKFHYPKIEENNKLKKYQYDIYDNGKLIKSYILNKNENNLLPFPETGNNWGRFGTRDRGGDNWINEKVCAALLGFFYSLPKNNYNGTLYFNDISANDGRNIGHTGHNIAGNDVDIRYPGSGNGAQTIWRDAMKIYGTEEKFISELENILFIGTKWGFNKNYAYKKGIKYTTGKATVVHQDHFHLGLR